MPKNDKSYQELDAELEDITLKLQSSDVDLDEATKLYERALIVLENLETHIKTAKNKVSQLKAAK